MWPDWLRNRWWWGLGCAPEDPTEAETSAEFLSQGVHSEATTRRGQALAEGGHLHLGQRRLLHRHAARTPFTSAESGGRKMGKGRSAVRAVGFKPRCTVKGNLELLGHPAVRVRSIPKLRKGLSGGNSGKESGRVFRAVIQVGPAGHPLAALSKAARPSPCPQSPTRFTAAIAEASCLRS